MLFKLIGPLRISVWMLGLLKASFLVHIFPCFLLMIFPVLCYLVLNVCADANTLYAKCDGASDLWQQLELDSELESDLETLDWGRKWLVNFDTGKAKRVLFYRWNNLVLLMSKCFSLSYMKNHQDAGIFSLLSWIGVLTLSSLLQAPVRTLEVLIRSMKFLRMSCFISINLLTLHGILLSRLEGESALNCYFNVLGELQKRVYRTFNATLAVSLEPLAHWIVASLSLLYRYYFGRCLFKLTQMASLPCSCGSCSRYSDRLDDFFSVIVSRC